MWIRFSRYACARSPVRFNTVAYTFPCSGAISEKGTYCKDSEGHRSHRIVCKAFEREYGEQACYALRCQFWFDEVSIDLSTSSAIEHFMPKFKHDISHNGVQGRSLCQ